MRMDASNWNTLVVEVAGVVTYSENGFVSLLSQNNAQ